jgi:hypothetical protein
MDRAMIYYVIILAAVTVAVAGFYAVRVYMRYRGKAVVSCPETGNPATVEVDAAYAALTFTRGIPELRLTNCMRWPERAGCGQDCMRQMELSPEQCIVRELLAGWYKGKSCIYCHQTFDEINWAEHKPAFYDAAKGRTVEWSEIPPEAIPLALVIHLPVCWNCHIAESFRRAHPELVVERPRHSAAHV